MNPGNWRSCFPSSDRIVAAVSALGIVAACLWTVLGQPERVVVIRDAQGRESVWPIDRDSVQKIAGRLGPVTVEIRGQRVRLLELNSPRLIGTLTGWIERSGQVTACIPCGVLVQVKGKKIGHNSSSDSHYDGIAR
ncbi:MAG: NusG domain II-containing protein [Magnetococcales bacterium]|nr:NusG domain II-containing protein [Magnetococcales bacterium]